MARTKGGSSGTEGAGGGPLDAPEAAADEAGDGAPEPTLPLVRKGLTSFDVEAKAALQSGGEGLAHFVHRHRPFQANVTIWERKPPAKEPKSISSIQPDFRKR